jgi:hypothetical protein
MTQAAMDGSASTPLDPAGPTTATRAGCAPMNVLLLTSHSIAEYDDLRMLSDLGYDVFSIGAYTNPGQPGDDKRPALPDVPYHADFEALCWEQRAATTATIRASSSTGPRVTCTRRSSTGPTRSSSTTSPKRGSPGQWPRIRDKRVIWRTCGQSDPRLEAAMARLDGLEIVRYSPKERNLGNYAGETTLIRFGKYPEDWGGWTGHWPVVGNVSQHAPEPHGRDDALNWRFWEEATQGLPRTFAGPHSEKIGGLGACPTTRCATTCGASGPISTPAPSPPATPSA